MYYIQYTHCCVRILNHIAKQQTVYINQQYTSNHINILRTQKCHSGTQKPDRHRHPDIFFGLHCVHEPFPCLLKFIVLRWRMLGRCHGDVMERWPTIHTRNWEMTFPGFCWFLLLFRQCREIDIICEQINHQLHRWNCSGLLQVHSPWIVLMGSDWWLLSPAIAHSQTWSRCFVGLSDMLGSWQHHVAFKIINLTNVYTGFC